MFASDLLTNHILPLRITDTLQTASERMSDFRVNHLPIVGDMELLGTLSESVLVEQPDYSMSLGSLSLGLNFSYIFDYQHAFEVFKIISEQGLTLVPVVDHQKHFLGTITLDRMVEYGSLITSAVQPGAILIIESTENNYSLSEITQILESNQCQILSLHVNSAQDSRKVFITLKVNKSDISSDLNALARFNYEVKFSHQETGFHDEAQERFESFMNYLNM